MINAKVLRKYAITESIRSLDTGQEVKLPLTVSYNSIASALKRLRKFGFDLQYSKTDKFHIITRRDETRRSENDC